MEKTDQNVLEHGPRRGVVTAPPSKSHAHRLMIADFLAGGSAWRGAAFGASADVAATRRCLAALAEDGTEPTLDCGESGSTLRFLAPVAAALGKRPRYIRRGRLADRPFQDYRTLSSGLHRLPGDISSQFVTGLLFALPLLDGDSSIRFLTPLESRGYVDMTCAVLRGAGVEVGAVPDGFDIAGKQRYREQATEVEGDWSGAAFWLAMNALGSDVRVTGLAADSAQPDRAIAALLASWRDEIDVSQCPDIFPVLTVVAAARAGETRFTGIRRLRLKECDRVAAMAETLTRFGAEVVVQEEDFTVRGTTAPFKTGHFRSFGDHRIAMSVAVGATRAEGPVTLDDTACAAKSYPDFFHLFANNRYRGPVT